VRQACALREAQVDKNKVNFFVKVIGDTDKLNQVFSMKACRFTWLTEHRFPQVFDEGAKKPK
jgi:hypothetical protein